MKEDIVIKHIFYLNRMNFIPMAMIILLIANQAVLSQPADSPWPMDGHDAQHTYQSQYPGPPYGNVKWKYEVGVKSDPVIGHDGTIYCASTDSCLYAIDSEGNFLWKYHTYSEISGSPAIDDDGTIYICVKDSLLFALYMDGTEKWRYKAGGMLLSSPVIDTEGIIYFGSNDKYLYALYQNGALKWKFEAENRITSSPSIGQAGNIYLFAYEKVYAINASGVEDWNNDLRSEIKSLAIGTNGPICQIYYGSLFTFNTDGSDNCLFGIGSGQASTPLAIGPDGTFYFGTGSVSSTTSQFLRAVDENGTIKWSYKKFIYNSPVIDVNGAIYFYSRNQLLALNDQGQEIWSFHLEEAFTTSPIIGYDQCMYIGSQNYLYCISRSTEPTIAISDSTLYFAKVKEGNSSHQEIVIYNRGSEPLQITNIVFSSPDFNTSNNSFSIDVDSSQILDIVFEPSIIDAKNDSMQIFSNDPDTPSLNVSLVYSHYSLSDGSWPKLYQNIQNTGYTPVESYAQAELKWKKKVYYAKYLSPIIGGGDSTIYLNLSAYKPDGSFKWRNNYNSSLTPIIGSDETLYFIYTWTDCLYSLNKGSTINRYNNVPEVTFSPTIDEGGSILVGTSTLYSVNIDGTIRWTYETGRTIKTTPAIYNGCIYFGSTDQYLYAISANGKLKWKYYTGSWNPSSPTVDSNGTVYFGATVPSRLYALNPDGSLKWYFSAPGGIESSPSIDKNGNIYFTSNDHILFAVDKNGSEKWRFEMGDSDRDDEWSSPAITSNGLIFVGSNDHYIYALDTLGNVQWKYKTGDAIFSSPAVDSEGNVYINSSDDYLYAFGQAVRPAPISDISIVNISSSSVTLSWTATGDDSLEGTASAYDLRYSETEITEENWESADQVSNPPSPSQSGVLQYFTINNLLPSSQYYFAIKAADEGNNWSNLSNVEFTMTDDTSAYEIFYNELANQGISIDMGSMILDSESNPCFVSYGNQNITIVSGIEGSGNAQSINLDTSVDKLSCVMGTDDNPYILYESEDFLILKYIDNFIWQTDTVVLQNIQEYSQPKIQSNGFPCFSYYDPVSHDLMYAIYDGLNWQTEMVDTTGDVGRASSLFVDRNGHPHISYYDVTQKKIKYAFYDGSSWHSLIVNSEPVKRNTKIIVDADNGVHIVYCSYTETCDFMDSGFCIIDGPDVPNLKYAYYNGQSWSYEDIEPSVDLEFNLFLNAEGNPCVQYYKGQRECINNVPFLGCMKTAVKPKSTYLACKKSNTWIKSQLWNAYHPGTYVMDTHSILHHCWITDGTLVYAQYNGTTWNDTQIIQHQEIVGRYNSIQIDAEDHLHISYYNESLGNLEYSCFSNGSWQSETVDTSGIVGQYSSLDVDQNRNPHICYYDETSHDMKYGYHDGSVWQIEKIDTTSDVGKYSVIKMNSENKAQIIYSDVSNSKLKYAIQNESSWDITVIDSSSTVESYSSLDLNGNDLPYIGYYDFNKKQMKCAFYNGYAWTVQIVDSVLQSFRDCSVDINRSGEPGICYISNGLLKYAIIEDSKWQSEVIAYENITTCDLQFFSGVPYICYSTSAGDVKCSVYNGQHWCVYNLNIKSNDFSFVIDESGALHCSYYDIENNDLKYIKFMINVDIQTSVDHQTALPVAFNLSQNYPNPFNPITNLRFDLPTQSKVKLMIYNVLGQKVRTLMDETREAGFYTVQWNGSDDFGRAVSTGVYLCRMQAGVYVKTVKVMMLR